MKILKIIAIICGVLIAVVGGFFGWFYVTKVVAPEPQAMCEHTLTLMKRDMASDLKKETGGGKLAEELAQKEIDAYEKGCVASAARRQDGNAVEYAKEAKCAVAASSYAELRTNCSGKQARK